MAAIKLIGKIQVTDEAGNIEEIPLLDAFTGATNIVKRTIPLTADTTATIWNPSAWTGYAPSSFDYLVMIADGDLDVEMTSDAGGTAFALNSFRLKANTPYILGADDSYGDRSADTDSAYGGTLTTLNKIRVDEPNSAAVNLQFILID